MIGLTIRRLAASRLARTSLLAWAALVLAAASIARHGATSTGVLVTSFASLALPLATLSLVSAATSGSSVRAAIRPIVELGGSPRRAAFALALTTSLVAAGVLGALASAAAVIAHGAADPPPVRDALSTFGVGALAALSYASLFTAASLAGRGGMRVAVLIADFLLGSGTGLGAAALPRAHVRALLAGVPAAGLSLRASSLVLAFMAVTGVVVVVVASRRA